MSAKRTSERRPWRKTSAGRAAAPTAPPQRTRAGDSGAGQVALAATLATAETVVRRAQTDRLAGYRPYPKQRDFHDAGAAHRERLLMAGNQVGKTWAAACEVAMHLTGRYPAWWRGRRFDHAVRFWAAGVTMVGTRDNPQRLLVGPPQREEDWGTAAIPAECLDGYSRARGTADALDSVVVRHAGGGHSYLGFKAYEQGRKKWQGETLHGVWFDEEPPEAIYMEGLSRTNATGGITMITFTPLLGLSRVVRMFLSEGDVGAMGSSFAKTTEGR